MPGHHPRMPDLLIVLARALASAFRGHRELVFENLALAPAAGDLEPLEYARPSSDCTDCFRSPWAESGRTGDDVDARAT
jgi:hypothetical protein